MRISVGNFCAVKKAEFEIENGITVLAGKNGCGKSQLLIAIAYHCRRQRHFEEYQVIRDYGFHSSVLKRATVSLSPRANGVLWRPPVRKICEGTLDKQYATLEPIEKINLIQDLGYTSEVDDRYLRTGTFVK